MYMGWLFHLLLLQCTFTHSRIILIVAEQQKQDSLKNNKQNKLLYRNTTTNKIKHSEAAADTHTKHHTRTHRHNRYIIIQQFHLSIFSKFFKNSKTNHGPQTDHLEELSSSLEIPRYTLKIHGIRIEAT